MKHLGSYYFEGANAWGGNGDHWRHVYQVEPGDTGDRPDYGGRGQPAKPIPKPGQFIVAYDGAPTIDKKTGAITPPQYWGCWTDHEHKPALSQKNKKD